MNNTTCKTSLLPRTLMMMMMVMGVVGVSFIRYIYKCVTNANQQASRLVAYSDCLQHGVARCFNELSDSLPVIFTEK